MLKTAAKSLFFLCILLFSSCNNRHTPIYQKLSTWDNNLNKNPKVILDSLRYLDTAGISKKNQAYYSLLTSIAKSKSGIMERRDSVITAAASFFEKENDYYNLCRALLYKGIIQYNLTRPSIKIYTSLKSAERYIINTNLTIRRLRQRYTDIWERLSVTIEILQTRSLILKKVSESMTV